MFNTASSAATSDSTVSEEDAGIEPRTVVATSALAVTDRLDLIHDRLDLIHKTTFRQD